jgi:pimeloyl-ACP methyl ester carboxylesterase
MQRRDLLKILAVGSAAAIIPAAGRAQGQEATPTMTTTTASGYAPVNGLEIYYEIHGKDQGNTPLLVMHGSYMTIDSMLAFIGPMAATRQVIAFEAQGHGRTADLASRELTYENMADDAAGLLDHLSVAEADVAGYSLGACTAIRLAIRHPEKVRKLVPIAGTFRLDGWDPRVREMIATITPDMFMDTPFHEEYLRLAPRPEDWPTFVEKLVAIDSTVPQDIPVEEMQAIAAPALVIAGDQDSSTPQHTVELFIALGGGTPGDLGLPVPKAQLAILPNTTHIQLLFVPEPAINAIVPPFLDAPMPDEATPAA